MHLRGLWALLILTLGAIGPWAPAFGQTQQPVPKLNTRVTDLTGTLTAEQQATLEDKLRTFEARKGVQIAVLIVATTEPEDIVNYSYRVAHNWKLGRAKIDDGALLIVAKDDRELRIEVGRALEGPLTDVTAHRIISDTIVPLFRQGDFYGGINAGLDQIIRIVDGEPLPPPDLAWQGTAEKNISHLVPFLFVAVFFGSVMLRAVFGRGLGAVIAGAVAGGLVYLAGQSIFVAVVAGLLAFLFALISGFSGGGLWSSYPRTGGWAGGFGRGSGGGWSGGTSGGGGFQGGGGRFNGGGASGSW
ncbi:MAG: YgcG family protein [Proteobacteria bacterium]|nr:YgcG family protein [Pseudomonadota bacterium]